ncbi:hypothetical protein FQN49_006381 [Arthroderma sp. PD_2]|nr:hypothetical protein FQN49_006381 [Arthroderma sp. PD_2]
MRVNFISLIWLFILFFQLGDAVGIPSPHRRTPAPKERLIRSLHSCNSEQTARINIAIDDARAALLVAVSRLEALLRFLETNPEPQAVVSARNKVTLWTFESIFRQVYWGPPQRHLNPVGVAIVRNFLRVMRGLVEAVRDTTSLVEIHCGDSFLTRDFPLDPPPNVENNPNLFYDSRPFERGGDRLIEPNLRCHPTRGPDGQVKPSPTAFSMDVEIEDGGTLCLIVICDTAFNLWNYGPTGGSLQAYRNLRLHNNYPLDGFGGTYNPGSLILHEFTHCSVLTAMKTIDVGYGWAQIINVPRHQVFDNADSIAYFVVAMYLDNHDWSNGYADPLPP